MFKNTTNENDVILICECHSIDHQIRFDHDKDDNEIYVSIHLVTSNFFKRLIHGIKYIFGFKSVYGDFDSFIFKKEHADVLIKMGNLLKEDKPL